MSWGTHGELQGRVQQLMVTNFVTDVVMIDRVWVVYICASHSANWNCTKLQQYTDFHVI